MEQTKLLDYIQRISGTLARYSTFDIYDEDDIGQEIFFLMGQAEEVYDPAKGDEYAFYLNFVSNRLKNIKRDRYLNNSEKKNIADAESLGNEEDIEESSSANLFEYVEEIDKSIAANLRGDYLKFKEGAKLPHRNKHIIIQHIKEIVERIESRKKY